MKCCKSSIELSYIILLHCSVCRMCHCSWWKQPRETASLWRKWEFSPFIHSTSNQPVLTWTNVVFAILKGAAKNETLRTLRLGLPDESLPAPELDDEGRRSNPKLQLTVWAGSSCESEHVTVGMTVAWAEGLYSTPHRTKWGCLKCKCNGISRI